MSISDMTKNTGIHTLYITGILSQCLPNCTYMSALLMQTVYRQHITAHILKKSRNYNIYLPYYCKICDSNKYAPQMPYAPII